jgi:molybdopterin/thiamine biosynthesis adenylyltransferase
VGDVVREVVLLPSSVVDAIRSAQAPWGTLIAQVVAHEGLAVITGSLARGQVGGRVASPFVVSHHAYSADITGGWGAWYRAEPQLHSEWLIARARDAQIQTAHVRSMIRQGWREPGPDGFFVLTLADAADGTPEWCGWWVTDEYTRPFNLVYFDEGEDALEPLRTYWPIEELGNFDVTLVGVGSIGSATLDALVEYGIRNVTIVDDDRLLQHNLVRHRLGPRDIGRRKVDALADRVRELHPHVMVTPLAKNVVDDANLMRPLFKRSDVVIATLDGIASRQVADHLAHWARVPIVLAAVLDDGGLGELLRFRPGFSTGCLKCHRAALRDAGAMDPEVEIDGGYGTGRVHRPMTAVGGDLAVIGQLAAKAAVATLLEARGHREQRLPGDHAIVGLQPAPDLAEPFDAAGPCAVAWFDLKPPRPDCPTCALT